MKQSNVSNIIDKHIIEKSLISGMSFLDINQELHNRIETIFRTVKDDYGSIENLLKIDVESKPAKHKYVFYFIKHSIKRISDVHWMFYNKNKLSRYTDSQIFNLIKLKDKLKNESQKN